MSLHARAPGKLFLLGEYAVLSGGWSLLATADRFVHVDVDATREGYEVIGGDISADTRLPRAAMRALSLREDRVDHLRADLSELYLDGQKLGLGSSAASTVAAMLAVQPELQGHPDVLFEHAFRAHRDIQGGRGSCADVASSAFGGLTAYRLKAPQQPFSPIESCASFEGSLSLEQAQVLTGLHLPRSLRIEAIWMSSPASSTGLIGSLERVYSSNATFVDETFVSISSGVERVMAALCDPLQREDVRCARMVSVAREAQETMREFATRLGLPIMTPEHDALVLHAREHQISAKISGAGGGDFSLLLGHYDADWTSLLASLPPGCRHVPLVLGQHHAAV